MSLFADNLLFLRQYLEDLATVQISELTLAGHINDLSSYLAERSGARPADMVLSEGIEPPLLSRLPLTLTEQFMELPAGVEPA